MKKERHTPRPWKYGEDKDNPTMITGPRTNDGAFFYLADAHLLDWENPTVEESANIRLIVSAPELLDACKRLVNVHTGAPWQTEAVRRDAFIAAMDAISKAEGKD